MAKLPSIGEMCKILGDPKAPKVITQKAFDCVQTPLERLAALQPGDQPEESDLIDYALDLKYVSPLQKDLMLYVLPFCLGSWYQALIKNQSSNFTQEFHAALASRGNVIAETAGLEVQDFVRDYQRRGILDSMARENSLEHTGMQSTPYRWIHHLASYGTIWDDVETLVREWREMRVEGYAICCLQYFSSLAFRTYENPVFSPWTGEGGGGPPLFWVYESLGFQECWKEKNLEFFRHFLTVEEVKSWAAEAAQVVREHPHRNRARLVVEGISTTPGRVESRLADLFRYLGTPSRPEVWEWSDYDE